MIKPIKHTCCDCGNAYYYRKIKDRRKCPVCRGTLKPEGYRLISMCGGLGPAWTTWINDIPAPPMRKPGEMEAHHD